MLICIDVGNTSTSYGIYKGKGFIRTGYTRTDKFPKYLPKLMRKGETDPHTDIILCSVVPQITKKLRRVVGESGVPFRLLLVGENVRVPIRHKYRSIRRLGSDRLVNAYGGMRLYGFPLLIFDYGTALTCDYISEKGVYSGGLIIPGPELSLKTLSQGTALLPEIPFPKRYQAFLGRDTQSGMKAGILQGYGAMTDGLVARFRERFGRRFRVVATGGLAPVISRYASSINRVDPLLTLKSLVRLLKDRKDRVKLPS